MKNPTFTPVQQFQTATVRTWHLGGKSGQGMIWHKMTYRSDWFSVITESLHIGRPLAINYNKNITDKRRASRKQTNRERVLKIKRDLSISSSYAWISARGRTITLHRPRALNDRRDELAVFMNKEWKAKFLKSEVHEKDVVYLWHQVFTATKF